MTDYDGLRTTACTTEPEPSLGGLCCRPWPSSPVTCTPDTCPPGTRPVGLREVKKIGVFIRPSFFLIFRSRPFPLTQRDILMNGPATFPRCSIYSRFFSPGFFFVGSSLIQVSDASNEQFINPI